MAQKSRICRNTGWHVVTRHFSTCGGIIFCRNEADAGGTAFSKAMINMQLAVETNSKSLKDWASVAGISADEFSKKFKEDATGALQVFIEGLENVEEKVNRLSKS